ncbi:glycosyl transferase related to UDP- glucuronosyltransferase-like protein [Gordonia neofelifaecis NRRL B-59395]|uniref:Glycosyl transferase related to UDP-glucuronosyltransferase-like protein n=1 Tax=Gordonia neofelifaecis NRRL B-59395 TaxID=644548 RepID=F1YMV5_9ACTN|nr:glycosyl transferase related to UDP- glucuronosyltransferase-like protein [Gordonia neofelifaecis NRRL B-59395]
MAGSDAGHAFPALGLATAFLAAGDRPIVYTGERWIPVAAERGIEVRPLPGLAARPGEDDDDAGAKLSVRAARMALELAPELALTGVDLVVSDVITIAGGWAAELVGVPWIELSPHPLYEQSSGLPPIGAGLAAGEGFRGRLRDTVLRSSSAPAVAKGRRQRRRARASIGLPAEPSPIARFVATLPGLEVPRPDWPARTHLVGPLLFEPTAECFDRPAGDGPLIVVAPSTAATGAGDLGAEALSALAELQARRPVRVVFSALQPPNAAEAPRGLVAATARQDELLPDADLVICGAGHGMLAKTLLAGVPVVTVPGGGDQWELASRVQRIGCGLLVRPATAEALAAAVVEVLDDDRYASAARRVADTVAGVVDPVATAHRAYAREAAAGQSWRMDSCV